MMRSCYTYRLGTRCFCPHLRVRERTPPQPNPASFRGAAPSPSCVIVCDVGFSLSLCNVLFRSTGTLCSSFEKWPYLASDAKHFNWTLARRMGMGNQERTDEERSPNKVKGIRIYYCLPVVVFLWWRKINTLMMGVVESVYAYTNPGKKNKKGIIFPGKKKKKHLCVTFSSCSCARHRIIR